ncbi:MAG: hypothetical protein HKL89_00355 [Candidatus Dormibacteraeota bacterium]|nr:hypothetical protein [Candidatus Dormibacteraeota bacterium]
MNHRWSLVALAGLLLAGGIAGCSPATGAPTSPRPAGATGSKQLVVDNGSQSLTVSAASLGSALYRATPAGALSVTASPDGIVEVRQGKTGQAATRIAIELSRSVTWAITIRGGTTTCNLDLAGLRLGGLTVSGGAETMRLNLPPPHGRVDVIVSGGATHLVIAAPGGAAMRVVAAAGIAVVRASGAGVVLADNSHLVTYGSYAGAANSYSVDLTAGAATLNLSEP